MYAQERTVTWLIPSCWLSRGYLLRINCQDVAYFDGTTSGELTSRLTNDIQGMVLPDSHSNLAHLTVRCHLPFVPYLSLQLPGYEWLQSQSIYWLSRQLSPKSAADSQSPATVTLHSQFWLIGCVHTTLDIISKWLMLKQCWCTMTDTNETQGLTQP